MMLHDRQPSGSHAAALRMLLRPNECPDWGSKLQNFSRDFWADLEDNPSVAAPCIDDFVRLLQQQDSLALVQNVLPDLRGTSVPETINKYKQRILHGIIDLRKEISRIGSIQQADFDDVSYQEEKQIFEEAELYRAELLLFSRGSLTDLKRKELQQWWSNRPTSDAGKGHGISTTRNEEGPGKSHRIELSTKVNPIDGRHGERDGKNT
ncbi:MAG: hypothetical protein Q9226_007388 [Calogaya cf. arnoldii]